MDNYNAYFNSLDNYYNNKKDQEEYICCDNQNIVKDNTYLSCTNCGVITLDNLNYIKPKKYLNQRFHNCTIINSSVKFKSIRRLHHFSNYDYKEVVMQKYIYCIFFSCKYYDIEVDIDKLIEISNIEKKHYNKVIKKLEKKNVILSHSKIDKIIYLCKKNHLKFDKKKLLTEYQKFKTNKIKLNNNSILLGLLYDIVNIPENQFIKIFNTTKITLYKFKKIKDIQYKKKKN